MLVNKSFAPTRLFATFGCSSFHPCSLHSEKSSAFFEGSLRGKENLTPIKYNKISISFFKNGGVQCYAHIVFFFEKEIYFRKGEFFN